MSELVAGHFYTMSVMKHRCADRSWSHDVWEVLAINEISAVIKNAAPRHRDSFGAKPMVVLIAEFDWHEAGGLHAALADHALQAEVSKS